MQPNHATPMMVFLDCEFTDFVDIDLISIALVCEDGREFYAERSDFLRSACSDFVQTEVLPLLGKIPGAVMGRNELSATLRAWLAGLPAITLAYDSMHDRDLLASALDYNAQPNVVEWLNLNALPETEAEIFQKAASAYHDVADCPWHHALHDARAHLAGWVEAHLSSSEIHDLRALKTKRQKAEFERVCAQHLADAVPRREEGSG